MPTDQPTVMSADVIVIGMGAAGVIAAQEAARAGAKVYVISKMGPRAPNCTTRAWGGFTYSTDDTADELFAQVVETGGFLNNQELVAAFVQDTPRTLASLTDLGVEWDESMLTSEAMPGIIRWSYRGKDLGLGMTETVREAALAAGAGFLYGQVVMRVITDAGRVAGLVTADLTEMKPVTWHAPAVVIATGGGARAYPRTDNPQGTTGDGIVLAYEAGAELVDLECVSFGFPEDRLGELLQLTEAPHEPFLKLGYAHYFLGGIKIGVSGETTLPGLYAAGEVAGGVFGAARLGGSALSDTIVFGARAGRAAALASREAEMPSLNEDQLAEEARRLEALKVGSLSPAEVGDRIRNLMWGYCGTMKTAATLDAAVAELSALGEQVEDLAATDGDQLREAVEVQNIHRLGGLVARASRLREETRGCFWRVDHPEPDTEGWLRNIIVRRGDDGPELRTEPVVMTQMTEPTPPRIGPGCFGYIERGPSRD